jgi:hypothetical protein
MEPEATRDSKLSRWIGYTAIIVFLVVILGIALISAGIFDPKPIGSLELTFEPGTLEVSAGASHFQKLDEVHSLSSGTIRLTAALIEGELDMGYGLSFGPVDQQVGIGISPLGYLTVWHDEGVLAADKEASPNIPWRTWPHVRQNFEENEIWADIENQRLKTIYVNRELLWQGDIPIQSVPLSIWAESFGESTKVNYPKLEIYAP